VLGPERHGVLGGKPRRLPVPGIRVVVKSDRAESGIAVDSPENTTDAAGSARFAVTLGKQVGDQYLVARCPDYPEVSPITIRFVAGIVVRGGSQEVAAGDSLPESIRLEVTDDAGNPVAGVPVYFRLGPQGTKAKLSADRATTDETGTAGVPMDTDPSRTGRYEVIAEVSAPSQGIAVRGIAIPVLAMNRMSLLIGVLGGLGIFILGMKLMSDGLQQTAGDRLKAILQFFTRNRVTAVFAGLVVKFGPIIGEMLGLH